LRKSSPKADDADLKEAIACVVKDRATYGYMRVWARLKIDGRQINKTGVPSDARRRMVVVRQGQKPMDTRGARLTALTTRTRGMVSRTLFAT
jgi:hypothetical protein